MPNLGGGREKGSCLMIKKIDRVHSALPKNPDDVP